MTERKLFLCTIGAALGFGLLFWLVDSLAHQYYFSPQLCRRMARPSENLLDAVLLNISAHMLFVRLSFLTTCLIGGWLAAYFMNNLRKSEERLRQVVENMPVMMDAFDKDYNLMAWNQECERVTGYRAEEIVGAPLSLERLYPDAEYREDMLAELIRLGADFRDREWTLTARDGTKKTISWSNLSARVPIPGWDDWAVGVDVTERVLAQRRIAHLNAVLRTIRKINQLSARENDQQVLIEQSCRLLTETRDYHHAWIVLLDRHGAVTGTASAGLPRHTEAIDCHVSRTGAVSCIRQALTRLGPICILDTATQCPHCPLNHVYQESGALSIRLEHDGTTYGVMSVAVPLSFFQDDEERALFEDAAGDIALALHGIKQEERRKQTEDELRKSRANLSALIENTNDSIWSIDREYRLIVGNSLFLHNVGAIRGRSFGPGDSVFTEDFPADALEAWRGYYDRALRGECFTVEMPRRLIDTVRCMEYHFSPIRDNDGSVTGVTVLEHDITERKLAEIALRESEEKYRTLVEQANEGILIMQDRKRKYHNARWLEITGYSASDYPDIQLFARIHPDDVGHIETRYAKILAGDELEPSAEFRLISRSGEIVWLSSNSSRVHWEGRPAVMTIFEDITKRKWAEEQLTAYSENLETLVEERTRELQDAQEQLVRQGKLAVLGQMAGSVGHELRTPLAAISNAVYFLKMVLTAADEAPHQETTLQEYLEIINSEVRTAGKIITDLLDFSRVKSLERQDIQVADVVGLVLDKHEPPDAVQVVTEIPDDLPAIVADPTHLDQSLSNLVTNAYQAMPDGGTLTIRTGIEEHAVLLSVTDTGCGVAPEHIDKLFEPLFTTKPKGIGLGLAVCKNLIEANGGAITVESQKNRGSTFTLWLPGVSGEQDGGQYKEIRHA